MSCKIRSWMTLCQYVSVRLASENRFGKTIFFSGNVYGLNWKAPWRKKPGD